MNLDLLKRISAEIFATNIADNSTAPSIKESEFATQNSNKPINAAQQTPRRLTIRTISRVGENLIRLDLKENLDSIESTATFVIPAQAGISEIAKKSQTITQDLIESKPIESPTALQDSNKPAPKESIFFDLTKSKSLVFIAPRESFGTRIFSAPFDKSLSLLNSAQILGSQIDGQNRILRLFLRTSGSYKASCYTLQLEFTGRNTNAILLDQKNIIQAALHFVPAHFSRPILLGHTLPPLPQPTHRTAPNTAQDSIESKNIESTDKNTAYTPLLPLLRELYRARLHENLHSAQNALNAKIQAKLNSLKVQITALKSENDLLFQAQTNQTYAELLIAHMNEISDFRGTEITLDLNKSAQNTKQTTAPIESTPQDSIKKDSIKQNQITIPLPYNAPSPAAQSYFKAAKKLRAKAANIHRERENLNERIDFYLRLLNAAQNAQNLATLEILRSNFAKNRHRIAIQDSIESTPPNATQNSNKSTQKAQIESFFIDSYKISIGRSEKANLALLHSTRADDLWLHIRALPSSHLIIHCGRIKPPKEVISQAAELLVSLCGSRGGRYEIDFTRRKFVKLTGRGACVIYDKYETISPSIL